MACFLLICMRQRYEKSGAKTNFIRFCRCGAFEDRYEPGAKANLFDSAVRKHSEHGRRCVKEHARLPCAVLLGVHSGAGRCGPRGVRPIRCVRSAGCPGGGMTGCRKPARQDDGRGRSAGADAENSDGGLALLRLPFVRERAACCPWEGGRWTVAAGRASPAAAGAARSDRSDPCPLRAVEAEKTSCRLGIHDYFSYLCPGCL